MILNLNTDKIFSFLLGIIVVIIFYYIYEPPCIIKEVN